MEHDIFGRRHRRRIWCWRRSWQGQTGMTLLIGLVSRPATPTEEIRSFSRQTRRDRIRRRRWSGRLRSRTCGALSVGCDLAHRTTTQAQRCGSSTGRRTTVAGTLYGIVFGRLIWFLCLSFNAALIFELCRSAGPEAWRARDGRLFRLFASEFPAYKATSRQGRDFFTRCLGVRATDLTNSRNSNTRIELIENRHFDLPLNH